jgi:hypothetical protein
MRKVMAAFALAIAVAIAPLAGSATAGASSTHVQGSAADPDTPAAYHLINGHGKCLTIADANTGDNVHAQQWTCNHTKQQYWILQGAGPGYLKLKNLATSKCLSIYHNSPNPGAAVVQFNCTINHPAFEEWSAITSGTSAELCNLGDHGTGDTCMHADGSGAADGLEMYVNTGYDQSYVWHLSSNPYSP